MFHLKTDCFFYHCFCRGMQEQFFCQKVQYEAEPLCALLAPHRPTARRQEGALHPNRCQHELEMTPTVAQISSWSLDGGRTENTAHICNKFKRLVAAHRAKQISHSQFSVKCTTPGDNMFKKFQEILQSKREACFLLLLFWLTFAQMHCCLSVCFFL